MRLRKLPIILVTILLISLTSRASLAESYLEDNYVDIKNSINISASTGNNNSNDSKNGKVEIKAEVKNEINGIETNSFELDKSYDQQDIKLELKNEILNENNNIKTNNELKINSQGQVQENKNIYKKIDDNPKKLIGEKPTINNSIKKADTPPKKVISNQKNENNNSNKTSIWKKITVNINNLYNFLSAKIKSFTYIKLSQKYEKK
ncbi:MAG: hypothetical protein US81_C0011G0006 [Parcubacteria group bacterium GW2011_GWE2_38_18]|nr:MAG: hypothetical protein US81_C0011G0006 [Parcubacteria group bacterium GW2011_GWE2_38_18]